MPQPVEGLQARPSRLSLNSHQVNDIRGLQSFDEVWQREADSFGRHTESCLISRTTSAVVVND